MLRSYAAAGVLSPVAVDRVSGYRYYSQQQVGQARTVGLLRRARIPLAETAVFLTGPTYDQIELWQAQLDDEFDIRRHALDAARKELNEKSTLPAVIGPRQDSGRERTTTTMATVMSAATGTDRGLLRDTNQDAVLAEGILYAVADGMGAAGDTASRWALETLRSEFTAAPSPDGLIRACRQANRMIWEHASAVPEFDGMGSTITALAMLPADQGGPVAVNVGDSRLYRIRDGRMEQLTEDHTIVGSLVRSGELTREQARSHPQRHLLTMALGIESEVTPDVVAVECRAGDRLLISTDGLFNDVPESEIITAVMASDPASAVRQLVDMAKAAGGADNITVVVLDAS